MGKQSVKIVVAGPVNAGKSTLIRSASDVPVICTNEMATDDVLEKKAETTVAMDHGICFLTDGSEVHLYGTPGQRRFDFMWEILAIGADAILFLVDASDPTSIDELQYIYDHFDQRHDMPVLVALTRHDHADAISIKSMAQLLHLDDAYVTTFDPRQCDQARALMHQIYKQATVENRHPADALI